jgi:hypothetical protein
MRFAVATAGPFGTTARELFSRPHVLLAPTAPFRATARRYHDLYMQVKGARYKTKRTLMETIHKQKSEQARVKVIADQAVVAKAKAAKKNEKRAAAKEKVQA